MKIIECPRDAMQGIKDFIPTDVKVTYVNQLLKVGFDTLDVGSFVSPNAIPQMKDTGEVLKKINDPGATKLLAIVANKRGALEAVAFEQIKYLGFPFSISETFQKRNTNKSIDEALTAIDDIQDICANTDKTLVTYISMGFGNPYGDDYDTEVVLHYCQKLIEKDIKIISLADTIGVSEPQQIHFLFKSLARAYPYIEFGAHLHSNPSTAREKVEAAYSAGCKRFDGAIKGFGGCPMANDDLVGNMATEIILEYLTSQNNAPVINIAEFEKALALATNVFPH